MDLNKKKALLDFLLGFISDNKRNKFDAIIANRTRYLTVVLEDIYQPHNASAVLRSCDCFGIQDVHIIENENPYEVNPDVALGSSKWLDLIKYNTTKNNTPAALAALKAKGYRIVATTPHKNDVELQNLDLAKGPVALLFGTELRGLSQESLDLADEYVKIPMHGFTESFNISVSAALCLFYLSDKLRKSELAWRLSEEEQVDVKTEWCRRVIKMSAELEEKFIASYPAKTESKPTSRKD
jgi:tRNA (guanosine-2'-O-)-methyltransferase